MKVRTMTVSNPLVEGWVAYKVIHPEDASKLVDAEDAWQEAIAVAREHGAKLPAWVETRRQLAGLIEDLLAEHPASRSDTWEEELAGLLEAEDMAKQWIRAHYKRPEEEHLGYATKSDWPVYPANPLVRR